MLNRKKLKPNWKEILTCSSCREIVDSCNKRGHFPGEKVLALMCSDQSRAEYKQIFDLKIKLT